MINTIMDKLQDQEIRTEFGKRLKLLRIERNLGQKELAALLSIRNTYLYKYEAGIHAPPMEKLILIAEIFGVSIDFLITGNVPSNAPVKNTRLAQRFKVLEEFNPNDQETVVILIDAMVARKMINDAANPFGNQPATQ